MRLIDADELIKATKRGANFAALFADEDLKIRVLRAMRKFMKRCIIDAPTVDAVPVKHGHWIEKEYKYGGLMAEKMFCICSVCGEEQIQKLDDKFEQFMTPYCANCGAKMDGGESDAKPNTK